MKEAEGHKPREEVMKREEGQEGPERRDVEMLDLRRRGDAMQGQGRWVAWVDADGATRGPLPHSTAGSPSGKTTTTYETSALAPLNVLLHRHPNPRARLQVSHVSQ